VKIQNLLILISILLIPHLLPAQSNEGLVSSWKFNSESIQENTVKDLVGDAHITIEGSNTLDAYGYPESLLIDRDNSLVQIDYSPDAAYLPKKQITAEIWVRIEKTVEWGGLLGPIQDNGGYQKGWLLGFRQSNFSFGLASKGADDGDGKITYALSPNSLEWGQWYHVVGTYDGKTLKIYVNGELEKSSDEQSGEILYPEKAKYIVGAFVDDNDNFRPRSLVSEANIFNRALDDKEIRNRYQEKKDQYIPRFQPIIGPYLNRVTKEKLVLHWETDTPTPSRVVFGYQFPLTRIIEDATPKKKHTLTIDQIESDKLYFYRILTEDNSSRLYEFDSSFDYTPVQVKAKMNPFPIDDKTKIVEAAVEEILRETKIQQGYCVIVGIDEGRLAYELAKRSDLQIIGIDTDPTKIQKARRALDQAGLYGSRVTFQHCTSDSLPYSDYLANLIVSESLLLDKEMPYSKDELYRILRPSGGVIMLGKPGEKEDDASPTNSMHEKILTALLDIKSESDSNTVKENWAILQRGRLPGSGDWTHMYGNESNTSSNSDVHPRLPMQVAWFGRPGPRPMVDRGTRSPATPLHQWPLICPR
jgi:hypothetical protein